MINGNPKLKTISEVESRFIPAANQRLVYEQYNLMFSNLGDDDGPGLVRITNSHKVAGDASWHNSEVMTGELCDLIALANLCNRSLANLKRDGVPLPSISKLTKTVIKELEPERAMDI